MCRALLLLCGTALLASCLSTGGPRAEKYFVDAQSRALAEAARVGDAKRIAALISAGVDVNAKGRGNLTAVTWALLHQSKVGFSYLLTQGADPNIQLTESFDDILLEGRSAMAYASMHKDSWYLKEALKVRGNPNLVNSTRSFTPIMDSISSRRPDNVRLLLAAGANPNWQNRDGQTPMMIAATSNQYDVVYTLLEAGADPRLQTTWGTTIVSVIKLIRTDPKSEQWKWRARVIERLVSAGLDFENGR